MRNKQIITIFVLLTLAVNVNNAQKLVNLPYARFNLGGLNSSGSFRSIAMGGTGVAMRNNNSIYFVNAASYTSIDTTSFVFEFGLDYSIANLNDGENSYTSGDLNFNHLLMGFPIGKKIGMAIGITSFSNGYYYLSESITSDDPEYDPVIGDVFSIHKGTGSISNFFLGAGIDITRNLSAGANMIVTLGEITRLNQYEFGDFANTFTQLGSEDLKLSGVRFDYGLQYSQPLKNDFFITAGLSYSMKSNFKSGLERSKQRFTVYDAPPYSPDTLAYSYVTTGDSTSLPSAIKAGLAFGKKDKLVVEMDYIFTNWGEATIQGNYANTLASTHSAMIGMEYVPDMFSNTSFFKRVEYRLGAHYSDNYLKIGDTQLKEIGISCGFGIRMNNTYSKASIYFDYTKRKGDIDKGMHDENIFSIGASLNLYDFWFRKRVYY